MFHRTHQVDVSFCCPDEVFWGRYPFLGQNDWLINCVILHWRMRILRVVSGNLSPNQGQSIDRDMFEKKLQSDLIKDTCGIFIKALLIMRQLRQNADEQGKEIEFRLIDPTALSGERNYILNSFLIAASSIPGGYYSAPKFLQFKEFELYWGAVFFTTRRGVMEKSFF